MEEKEKKITKNKARIVKAAVETLNLNISYQKKENLLKSKKYKIYDDEDDDLNDDVGSASESNEESNNFNDDEDDDNVTYEKIANNKTKNKEISNYLNKSNLTKFYHKIYSK